MNEEEVEMAVQSEFSIGNRNRQQFSTSICLLLLTFLIALRGIN